MWQDPGRHQRQAHLLLTQKTAPDSDYPAVLRSTTQGVPAQGADPRQDKLHPDRILYAAFTTGRRPAQAPALFGHHRLDRHALRRTAAPERTAKLPSQRAPAESRAVAKAVAVR